MPCRRNKRNKKSLFIITRFSRKIKTSLIEMERKKESHRIFRQQYPTSRRLLKRCLATHVIGRSSDSSQPLRLPDKQISVAKRMQWPFTNETYSSGYCFGFSPNSLLSPAESHVISDTINSTKIGILYMYVQKKDKKRVPSPIRREWHP